jgi:hypothetical protein
VNDGSVNPYSGYLALRKEMNHLTKDAVKEKREYLASAQYQAKEDHELTN